MPAERRPAARRRRCRRHVPGQRHLARGRELRDRLGSGGGRSRARSLTAGDATVEALAGYRRRLENNFVLKDHRKPRRVPHLIMSERIEQQYPPFVCDLVERMFTVDNPAPKPGMRRWATGSPRARCPYARPDPGRRERLEELYMSVATNDRRPDPPPTDVAGTSHPMGEAVERDRRTGVPFSDRMATVEFRVAERAHIVVDSERCEGCPRRPASPPVRQTCSCPRPRARFCSTTSSPSSAAPATWPATWRARSHGATRRAASASPCGAE